MPRKTNEQLESERQERMSQVVGYVSDLLLDDYSDRSAEAWDLVELLVGLVDLDVISRVGDDVYGAGPHGLHLSRTQQSTLRRIEEALVQD